MQTQEVDVPQGIPVPQGLVWVPRGGWRQGGGSLGLALTEECSVYPRTLEGGPRCSPEVTYTQASGGVKGHTEFAAHARLGAQLWSPMVRDPR